VSKWHVTLVFLGSAPADDVAAALDSVPVSGPFSLRLTGGGRFGSAALAGVTGDISELSELRERVRGACIAAGFPSDERPYQPHLTVSYHGNNAIDAALSGFRGSAWTVDSFALVNSHDGEYETLRTWPLRPPATPGPSHASG